VGDRRRILLAQAVKPCLGTLQRAARIGID
jgi:hypothetical protein